MKMENGIHPKNNGMSVFVVCFMDDISCNEEEKRTDMHKKIACRKSNSFHLCADGVVFKVMKIHHRRTPEEVTLHTNHAESDLLFNRYSLGA